MPTFNRRPQQIEACFFLGGETSAIKMLTFVSNNGGEAAYVAQSSASYIGLETPYGEGLRVPIDHWLVIYPDNTWGLIKDEEFDKLYEQVTVLEQKRVRPPVPIRDRMQQVSYDRRGLQFGDGNTQHNHF